MLQEGAFDGWVDSSFQPVGGAFHWPAGGEFGFQEGEELPVLEEVFGPAVAAAEFLVGPPPGLVAGFGVGWVVLGHGAFVDEGFPSFVPGVQGLTPTHRFLDGMDPGELVGESLEFLAGLKSWFECQVGFGVALHVHQAALDARARPAGMAGFLHAAKAVGDEHVGPGDAGGQGRVGRRVLLMAPLPVDDLARLPVDRYQEAPAVCHIRAVGHERVMDHPVRCDCRLDVPAPADPFTPGPGAHGPHLFPGPARQRPVQELPQLRGAGPVLPARGGRDRAGRTHPALRA